MRHIKVISLVSVPGIASVNTNDGPTASTVTKHKARIPRGSRISKKYINTQRG